MRKRKARIGTGTLNSRERDSHLKFTTIIDDLCSPNDQLRVAACVALGNLYMNSDVINCRENLLSPAVMRKLCDRLEDRNFHVKLHAAGAVRQVQMLCIVVLINILINQKHHIVKGP